MGGKATGTQYGKVKSSASFMRSIVFVRQNSLLQFLCICVLTVQWNVSVGTSNFLRLLQPKSHVLLVHGRNWFWHHYPWRTEESKSEGPKLGRGPRNWLQWLCPCHRRGPGPPQPRRQDVYFWRYITRSKNKVNLAESMSYCSSFILQIASRQTRHIGSTRINLCVQF